MKRFIVTFSPASKFQEKLFDDITKAIGKALDQHFHSTNKKNKIQITFEEEA